MLRLKLDAKRSIEEMLREVKREESQATLNPGATDSVGAHTAEGTDTHEMDPQASERAIQSNPCFFKDYNGIRMPCRLNRAPAPTQRNA